MDEGTVEPTLAEVVAELRQLRVENAGLSERLALVENTGPAQLDHTSQDHVTEATSEGQRVSRRGALLALGGAAAGGLGLAAGSVLGADPAAAANGNALKLGESNSASSTTSLSTTEGDGVMASTTQTGQSGVEGEDKSTKGGQGVRGTSTAGTGVQGVSTDGTAVEGTITGSTSGKSGVSGIDQSNGGGGHGVYGRSTLGNGV